MASHLEPLSHRRITALQLLFSALQRCPESEQLQLQMLVNKIGDGDRRVSSKALHLCWQLKRDFPAFSNALMAELKGLLFRQHLPMRAQYSVCLFLCQLPIHKMLVFVLLWKLFFLCNFF